MLYRIVSTGMSLNLEVLFFTANYLIFMFNFHNEWNGWLQKKPFFNLFDAKFREKIALFLVSVCPNNNNFIIL